MNCMPKISIIIPVYNVEKYLKKCLDSILNQTFQDFEIICVDDGSTDKSLEILQEYKRKDDRFVILQQRHAGAEVAKNNGVRLAENKHIYFLEADKYYEPDFIEKECVKNDSVNEVENFSIEPVKTDKDTIPVVFSFNDKYSKFFSVTLQSLICNSDSTKNYDIVVFSSDIKERSMKMLLGLIPQNFSLRFFSLTDFIQKSFKNIRLKEKDYWSVEMYYRIFVPIVMNKYKKVLYLDSDTLINSNIDEIFNLPFEDKKVLAVCDTISAELHLNNNRERKEYIKNVLGLRDETEYFNSGVLLFNIPAIDEKQYVKEILEVSQIKKLLYPDQDMLNVLFEKSVKHISSKWNYCSNVLICNKDYTEKISKEKKKEFLESRRNPKIIHFITPIKPWNSVGEEFYETFWLYARKSSFYEEILYALNQSQIEENNREIHLCTKLLTDKKIVLWGASIFLKEFLEKYNVTSKNVLGIIDKNPAQVGKKLGHYLIYSPEDLKRLNPDEVIITVVKSKFKEVIQDFLTQNGIKAKLTSLV